MQIVGDDEHVLHGVWHEIQILLVEGANGDGHVSKQVLW